MLKVHYLINNYLEYYDAAKLNFELQNFQKEKYTIPFIFGQLVKMIQGILVKLDSDKSYMKNLMNREALERNLEILKEI